jgi:hypothetical protein
MTEKVKLPIGARRAVSIVALRGVQAWSDNEAMEPLFPIEKDAVLTFVGFAEVRMEGESTAVYYRAKFNDVAVRVWPPHFRMP